MNEFDIDHEALGRLDELRGPFDLGHAYARVERATIMPDGKFETDGEHAISLAMIATCYALKHHPELDPYKVFFGAVMHDIDEHLHGDISTVGATEESLAHKAQLEHEGAEAKREILKQFPKMLEMLEQIEDLSIPESAFIKAMDKLAPGFTHIANNGKALKETYGIQNYDELLESVRVTDEKMKQYSANFEDVFAMRQETHRYVARVAFNDLENDA